MGEHLAGTGGAEADGVGHALVFGDAVVGQARWQIEHVARFQHPFVGLLEVGEDLQLQAVDQRAVGGAR